MLLNQLAEAFRHPTSHFFDRCSEPPVSLDFSNHILCGEIIHHVHDKQRIAVGITVNDPCQGWRKLVVGIARSEILTHLLWCQKPQPHFLTLTARLELLFYPFERMTTNTVSG